MEHYFRMSKGKNVSAVSKGKLNIFDNLSKIRFLHLNESNLYE